MFRVKLRIKSLKPYQRPAPPSPHIPSIEVDQDLLRRLYEAAKQGPPAGEWTRTYYPPVYLPRRDAPDAGGSLPYRGPDTCFLWDGVDPINRARAH